MEKISKMFKSLCSTNVQSEVDYTLESVDEYKKRWRSIHIIYFTMFLMSLGFSIVLTGIWPYLKKLDPKASKEFMGIIIAANPLGQMIFSPLFGWWSNKIMSVRLPLLVSLALFTIASAAYSSLELFPTNQKYWMLASRFLIGISSANIAVCRSYLSAATKLSERTKAVSMISLAQVLGFIVGPALQTIVTPLGHVGYTFLWNTFTLNMYNACGWINVLMSITNLIMFLPFCFEERTIAAREIMILQGRASERETWKAFKPKYFSAWILIVAFFVLVFNFVLLETLGTSLTMDQFAWTNKEALYYMGILMSVGAIVALITFVVITPLCKIFKEENVLIWGGFSLMVLGRILYIPYGKEPPKIAEDYISIVQNTTTGINETVLDEEMYLGCPRSQQWCATTPALTLSQFIIGYAFTSVGYPIGVTLIQTLFSKVLGPRPQGLWMGLMTGSGCFSRVLGPISVGSIYTRYGTYWIFGITSVMMLVSMIFLLMFRKHLIPPSLERTELKEMKTLNTGQELMSNDKLREES